MNDIINEIELLKRTKQMVLKSNFNSLDTNDLLSIICTAVNHTPKSEQYIKKLKTLTIQIIDAGLE